MPTLSSQEVIDFLNQNPSFILQHIGQLSEAEFCIGKNENLFLEKQLEALKEREIRQKEQLEWIVDSARSQRQQEGLFLEFAVSLLSDGYDRSDPVDWVAGLIRQQFGIEEVVVLGDEPGSPCRPDWLEGVRQRVSHRSSVCDDRVARSLLESMFGDSADLIESAAFVPLLYRDSMVGVLVLGSFDAKRFHPDLGVVLLDRLGQLVGGYLGGRQQCLE